MLQLEKKTATETIKGLGQRGKDTGKGENIYTTKATVGEMVEFIKQAPRIDSAGKSSIEDESTKDWDDNAGYKGAIELAEKGWPAGVKKMKKFEVEAGENFDTLPAFSYDIAGAFPSVPAYCAGDPEHMALPVDLPNKPVCKMVVEIGKAWHLRAATSMRYGVAILGAVNSLMMAGVTVVLDANWSGAFDYGQRDYSQWLIPLGGGGQVMDLDRLAYCLAHPALLRRIGFSYLERVKELAPTTKNGYLLNFGGGLFDTEEYDVHFPRVASDKDCKDAAAARQLVEGILNKAGYGNE